MPDLYLKTTELKLMSLRLEAIAANLNGTQHDIDQARGYLGSGELAGALDHFVSGWRDGRKRIVESTGALAKMASDTVENFISTDAALKNHITTQTYSP